MMREVRKIKFGNDGSISITWDEKRENGWNQFSICSGDRPEPEFVEAVKKLKIHVREILEFRESDDPRLNVVAVGYKHGDDGMAAVVTAVLHLTKSGVGVKFTTPPKKADGTPANKMTQGFFDALTEAHEWAIRYIEGKRAQGELFDEKKGGKE